MADLVAVMKKAGLDAVTASKPAHLLFGNVVSAEPLKIKVEQKMTLEGAQLILSRNVTDYRVEMTVEHQTGVESAHVHGVPAASTTTEPTSHAHVYQGRKSFLVHNKLVVGDKVILLREQGGQRFFVLDRLGVVE